MVITRARIAGVAHISNHVAAPQLFAFRYTILVPHQVSIVISKMTGRIELIESYAASLSTRSVRSFCLLLCSPDEVRGWYSGRQKVAARRRDCLCGRHRQCGPG